jgi:hypothetical protein
VVGASKDYNILWFGWRGRIRTFDLLIQSLFLGISLASRILSVRRASVGRRIGVSQVPIPKTDRVCCPIWACRVYRRRFDGSTAHGSLEPLGGASLVASTTNHGPEITGSFVPPDGPDIVRLLSERLPGNGSRGSHTGYPGSSRSLRRGRSAAIMPSATNRP